MTLNVAVIGCGNIGAVHGRMYTEHPKARLVAVCDIVPAKADQFAVRFGAKPYYSVEELLRSEAVDSVSVTTAGEENGGDHYEPTMQAIAAGKHVLCEKPLSNNYEQAKEMVRFAAERGVVLRNNLNHRFTPAAEKARKLIDEGQLGQP